MKKWIEDLLALQEVDIRMRKLAMRIKMLPREMNNLKEELATEKQALADAKDKVQKIELVIKKCESSIELQKEEICRLGAQSNLVRKNDEYNALLKEMDHHKEIVSDLETKELESMDKLEEAAAAYKQLDKDFASREKGLKQDMQEIVDLAGDMKEEVAKVKAERPKRAAKIDQDLLSTYDRLLSKGKGIPVSPVVGVNCGNCHLKLVPQVVNQALKGEYTNCGNCGFIVYSEG